MLGRIIFASILIALSVPASAATVQIVIQNLVSTPAEAHARVGDTVEWINKDVLAHSATARNGDWDVTIGPNKTGRLVLKKAGAVDYYCRFHPNMKARLIVDQ